MTATYFIQRLEIAKHRYLSFEGTASFTPGLNLLIGRNGSGKTTLLRLLKELSDGVAESGLQTFETDPPDRVVNRIVLERPEAQTSVEARAGGRQWSNWEALRHHVRFVTSDRQLTNTANIQKFLPRLEAFQASEPTQQLNVGEEFTKAIVAELIERLERLGKGLQQVTQDIEAGYRQALVDFGKDIRIDFDRDNFVYFVDHSGEEVPIDVLSAGEKEYLYFYSYLRRIQDDRNKILLIDEPELHLHSTQVTQICDMLRRLAANNQVIAATHSSEVLQYFLPVGHIVLLEGGRMTNIGVPEDMRTVISELGMPLDPSVFTSAWVVAENESGMTLPGEDAPDTPETLGWILGRSIRRRYWAFGSSRASVHGADQILSLASGDQGDIDLTVVLDGDRLCDGVENYPPTADPSSHRIRYLPCWELENLFLGPALLGELTTIAEEFVQDRLWRLVETHRERLLDTILKTITKNAVRALRPDHMIGAADPVHDLQRYKEAVSDLTINRDALSERFDAVIQERRWQWVPGKEVLGLLVGELPDFWRQLRGLDHAERSRVLAKGIEGSEIESLRLD